MRVICSTHRGSPPGWIRLFALSYPRYRLALARPVPGLPAARPSEGLRQDYQFDKCISSWTTRSFFDVPTARQSLRHTWPMRTGELNAITVAIGRAVVEVRPLAGGFSHETCLLTLADGDRVVVRLGGPDPATEAAVMSRARAHVPVPQVLCIMPAASEGVRPAMVLEHVAGTPLSDVLAAGEDGMAELGAEVGRVIACVGAVTFDRPGFFGGKELAVREMPPWSRQLPEMAAVCMDAVPDERLDASARRAWASLCAAHAPALAAIDGHARLVHADANPKNILVTPVGGGWRVDAVLDWESSFSGARVRRRREHDTVQRRLSPALHRRLLLRVFQVPARRTAPRQCLALSRPRAGHVCPQRPGHSPARASSSRPGSPANPAVDRRRCAGSTPGLVSLGLSPARTARAIF